MMKYALSLLSFLFFLTATPRTQAMWNAPIYNWGSGWCSTCYVYEHVDIPNSSSGWTGYFAGWAYEGTTGEKVTRIDLWIDGSTDLTASIYLAQYRADLYPYTGHYDNGWAVYPSAALASGTHSISLVFWYGMLSTTQTGTVVVP